MSKGEIMRYIYCLIISVLCSNIYAGSFTLENHGYVKWNVSVKKKAGSISVVRNGRTAKMAKLSMEERKQVDARLFSFSDFGRFKESTMGFSYSDERSQESIIKQMTNDFYVELMAKMQNIEVTFEDTYLSNIKCEETGFFKKVLNCHAKFKNVIEVDLQ